MYLTLEIQQYSSHTKPEEVQQSHWVIAKKVTHACILQTSTCYGTDLMPGIKQKRLSLEMNTFVAGDKRTLCWRQTPWHWRRTCFALETNRFCAGDKCFSTGSECVENMPLNFSHTHTASYQQLPNQTYMYVKMITSHSYYLWKCAVSDCSLHVHVDAQRCSPLH